MSVADAPPTADIPALSAVETPAEPHSLKARIKQHYDLCSSYYYSLWGEHIHHGYFDLSNSKQTKESAQVALISLLLSRSSLTSGSQVLDVGCGLGGTSRFLARNLRCTVTGLTISDEQVRMARKISGGSETTEDYVHIQPDSTDSSEKAEPSVTSKSPGKVRFIELDAETMGTWFAEQQATGKVTPCDAVWISEALSHFPNKQLFFKNAARVLKDRGKVILADWFRDEGLSETQMKDDIKPIEDGMLLPPLCTQNEYVAYAKQAGLSVFAEPLDISKQVSKTWDISISLVADPSLWALALTQGRDFISFLRAFKAMRKGYANGSFRYAVMVFEKAPKGA